MWCFFKRLWSYALGRTNDVTGRCAQRQFQAEDRLSRSVENLKDKADHYRHVSHQVAADLAVQRLGASSKE